MMPGAAAPVKARAGAAIAGPQVSARASTVLERAEPRVGFDYPNVILRGTTAHFSVYYDPDSLGVNGPVIADGVLATCENDYDVVYGYFGGINVGPMNVIIAGAMNSGKSTLVRALAGDINPFERLITVENERELFLHLMPERHHDVLSFEARAANSEGEGAVTMQSMTASYCVLRSRIIVPR